MVDIFTKAEMPIGIKHHEACVRRIKELKPDAEDVLLVAGILHDIERGINGDWKAGFMDPAALRKHQDLCTQEAEKFLKNKNVEINLIEKIKNLIAHHEEGGDGEQDILCDADCLTYFENSALRHAKNYKQNGKTKEEIKKKLDYMYFDRIIPSLTNPFSCEGASDTLNTYEKTCVGSPSYAR
jgi:hypothetical protein